jgi:dolichol-phosphate mannosyltransferase
MYLIPRAPSAPDPQGVFVILPVLNEIANIGTLLDNIEGALERIPFTIGVLDDGSTDGTVEYLRQRVERPDPHLHLICRQKRTRGSQRGSALRTLMLWGLANTRHQIFVEMDGDLSHRPEELVDGIDLVAQGGWDVAIASKYVPGSAVLNRPWGRRMVSKICSYAVRTLIDRRVRDYSNGYRFYSRAAAQFVGEHAYRYGSPIYLTEILALWMRTGFKVTECKSLYIGRNEGLSKLRGSDLIKAAIAAFEIAIRYHFTGFGERTPLSAEPSLRAIGNAARASSAGPE